MSIPIRNIFYLLCYAWEELEQKDKVNVDSFDPKNTSDLFAKVLFNGISRLIKKGLDRSYKIENEITSRIRGSISFKESFKNQIWKKGKLFCEYDELNHNNIQNQILKTTICNLINSTDLSQNRKKELIYINRYFNQVSKINLTSNTLNKVQLNRNNSNYRFLLNICDLIRLNLLPEKELDGKRVMMNFIEDPKKMWKLFEKFIKNFYIQEQKIYSVKSQKIEWDGESMDILSHDVLPEMRTDITLESKNRKIILDCKYYSKTLTSFFGKYKIQSPHLYQIYSYLKNKEKDFGWESCEGLILYPTINENHDYNYILSGHKIKIHTVNLNDDWENIHNELLSII